MATYLLLTFSSSGQFSVTNISALPYTLVCTNGDELIIQFKDVSAATGYRTRRISLSNVLAYVNGNLNGNGGNLTNLHSSVVVAGTNITVQTNIVAGTGQAKYNVNASFPLPTGTLEGYPPVIIARTSVDQAFTFNTTNAQNITELIVSLNAGTYVFKGMIGYTNRQAVLGQRGFGVDFNSGGCTIGSMRVGTLSTDGIGSVVEDIGIGTQRIQSFPSGALCTSCEQGIYWFDGIIVVSGAGTLQFRARTYDNGGGPGDLYDALKNSYVMFIRFQ